jgi:ABC-type spermidine/putrescine transport system permease subunit II
MAEARSGVSGEAGRHSAPFAAGFVGKTNFCRCELGAEAQAGQAVPDTLPLIAPDVVSAALFVFVISFEEAVVSFFISGLDRKTLPRKVFEEVNYNISPTLAAVATMLTLLTVLALLLGHLLRQKLDRRARVAAGEAP